MAVNARNDVELQTKWTKMTWRTFEENIRQAETGLSRSNSWQMMMMMMTTETLQSNY